MSTIKDVAKLAGVSTSTVSKYINGGNVRQECAAAIKSAVEALDYRVNPFARNLKAQRSRSIGVLMPDMTAPFFSSILTSMDKKLRSHGYHTLISCYGSNHGYERDNLHFLIANGVDGLIYVPENISADEFYELTSNFNIPAILVDRPIQGVQTDTVLVNNNESAYQAVSQLIQKGHRRIAAITGPGAVYTAKERLVGYLRALSDHSIIYDDSLVISDENAFATGYKGLEQLMDRTDPPTAILTTNYNITIGLVTAARERGIKLMEELDIFGFDCVDICTMMKPPLPVVFQPEQLIGQTAAQYLIDRLDGYNGPARATLLPCEVATILSE